MNQKVEKAVSVMTVVWVVQQLELVVQVTILELAELQVMQEMVLTAEMVEVLHL
jgi:hypothetical protein